MGQRQTAAIFGRVGGGFELLDTVHLAVLLEKDQVRLQRLQTDVTRFDPASRVHEARDAILAGEGDHETAEIAVMDERREVSCRAAFKTRVDAVFGVEALSLLRVTGVNTQRDLVAELAGELSEQSMVFQDDLGTVGDRGKVKSDEEDAAVRAVRNIRHR